LIRFIISIFIIYLLYKIVKFISRVKTGETENLQSPRKSAGGEDLIEDPVCHTYVPVSQAYKKEINGKAFFFCSKKCGDQYTLEKNN